MTRVLVKFYPTRDHSETLRCVDKILEITKVIIKFFLSLCVPVCQSAN